MADDPLTLGQLKEFLNGSGLSDDSIVVLEEPDRGDDGSTIEVPVVRVTATLNPGQRSSIAFHSF